MHICLVHASQFNNLTEPFDACRKFFLALLACCRHDIYLKACLYDLSMILRCTEEVAKQRRDVFTRENKSIDFNTEGTIKECKKQQSSSGEDGLCIAAIIVNFAGDIRDAAFNGVGRAAPEEMRRQRSLPPLTRRITKAQQELGPLRIFQKVPGRKIVRTLNNNEILPKDKYVHIVLQKRCDNDIADLVASKFKTGLQPKTEWRQTTSKDKHVSDTDEDADGDDLTQLGFDISDIPTEFQQAWLEEQGEENSTNVAEETIIANNSSAAAADVG